MKKYFIPGFGDCIIYNLFLDLNGTLSNYGVISERSAEYLIELKKYFNIYLVSANTRGNLEDICEKYKIEPLLLDKDLPEQDAKEKIVNMLDPNSTIVIGNGNVDVKALKRARIGICVIGDEGASKQAINTSDVIVKSIEDAFKIILDENALVATLRF